MTEQELDNQVVNASEYLIKKDNKGLEFWLKSKGFSQEERNYIRASMGGSDED